MNTHHTMDIFDVAFALTGDPMVNSRALRQLRLLSDLGANILVLAIADQSLDATINIPNVTMKYLPKPNGHGPQFFFNVYQQSKRALRNVVSRVYHASDLYVLAAMSQTATRHRGKLVFDSRELYTHVPAMIKRPWVRGVWSLVERKYIRKADCVFTVSESISKHLSDSYGLDSVYLMLNVPEPQKASTSPSLRKTLNVTDNITIILHQGSIQKHRGGSMMVNAMRYTENALLVFLGKGPLRGETERLVKDLNLSSKVKFLDPVSPDELLNVTATADIGITFLEDCCLNHKYALPNKLFEYLSAGIPVIASDLPEIRQIIERFDVGCVVPSGDVKALGAALNTAIQNPEYLYKWASNTSKFKENFNYTIESKHFLTPYRSLLEC